MTLHNTTSQKITIFMTTAMMTSDTRHYYVDQMKDNQVR